MNGKLWGDDIINSLICIVISDWSRNVLWKFVKLQSVITSLFVNRFSSGFHCYVWKFFTLSSEIKLNMLWSSSLTELYLLNAAGPNIQFYMKLMFHISLIKKKLCAMLIVFFAVRCVHFCIVLLFNENIIINRIPFSFYGLVAFSCHFTWIVLLIVIYLYLD